MPGGAYGVACMQNLCTCPPAPGAALGGANSPWQLQQVTLLSEFGVPQCGHGTIVNAPTPSAQPSFRTKEVYHTEAILATTGGREGVSQSGPRGPGDGARRIQREAAARLERDLDAPLVCLRCLTKWTA